MRVTKVNWYDHKPTDYNNGLIYGLEEIDDFPAYVEWFSSEEEREKAIEENKFEVV